MSIFFIQRESFFKFYMHVSKGESLWDLVWTKQLGAPCRQWVWMYMLWQPVIVFLTSSFTITCMLLPPLMTGAACSVSAALLRRWGALICHCYSGPGHLQDHELNRKDHGQPVLPRNVKNPQFFQINAEDFPVCCRFLLD